MHPTGGAGHVQDALFGAPPHGLPTVQGIVSKIARHPTEFVPQVMTSPAPVPLQYVPAPNAHSVGGAAHEQLAEPNAPVQGLPGGQPTRLVISRQPSASPHVATTVPDSQNVPCWFMHDVGGVGHEHDAFGCVPVHGLPTGHVVGVSL